MDETGYAKVVVLKRRTAANIARKKHTRETRVATNIAANYVILKQSTVNKLQKQAAKVVKKATLPENLQEGQEDNNISNSSNKESSDKDTWGLTQWPIKP